MSFPDPVVESRQPGQGTAGMQLAAVLEAAMDAIVVADRHQRVSLFNGAAERLFGMRRQDVVGRHLGVLLPEGMRERHARILEALEASTLRPRPMAGARVVHALRADGTEVPVEASISVARDDAGGAWFTVILRDVSERLREREILARSNLELQQFAFIASHDLRSPLRTIKGFVALAREPSRSASEVDRFLGRALAAVDRLDRLTSDLLVLARAESGVLPTEEVDMRRVFLEAAEMLQGSIQETGARIDVGTLPVVTGRRSQLVQLAQNLFANALRYCRQVPHIRVDAQGDGRWWTFTVSDNGIGVDPRQAPHVFEMFHRGHSEKFDEGTGMGLAICRKVVQNHGGRIWVEPGVGEGSRFRFTLPVSQAQRP